MNKQKTRTAEAYIALSFRQCVISNNSVNSIHLYRYDNITNKIWKNDLKKNVI